VNQADSLLVQLRGGETVVATDAKGHTFRCIVEVSAPHLGVIWAWDLHNHQRMLMSMDDFTLSAAPDEGFCLLAAGAPDRLQFVAVR